MSADPQAAVAARLPGAAALGLVAPPGAATVPAALFTDPRWTGERLRELGGRYATGNRRVLSVLWWYSASAVLVAPALAGLVTGRPLSARLADNRVALLGGRAALPIAAMSGAAGRDVAGELAEALGSAIAAVAAAGGARPRPLWAVATDSIAGRLLALGHATGDVPAASALAVRVAAAVGPPLPAPRFVDVGGARFVRRVSCCLLYRVPGQPVCTACPRRPAAEREALLAGVASRG